MTRALLAVIAVVALGAGAVSLAAQAGRRGDVLDANTASARQLQAVPGMTADLSRAILEQRPFASVLDLDKLIAASPSATRRAEIYARLFVQVNLNTAPDAELLLIPNLGDPMLAAIKKARPYRTLAQFRRDAGSDAARVEPYVFVPINLNTATDADILTIPGLGNRMLAEFKEYRPYQSLAHFRREIGKYVNEKELARLERYVTLN